MPKHLDELDILATVEIEKDVDGISALSLGKLVLGTADYISCTPQGIVTLLDRYDIPIKGKEAVVVGRSIILGKPAALALLERHATVTICHSRTENLPDVVRRADILVAAIGKAEFIKGDWIKEGAVVIDAGYNRVEGIEPRCRRRGVRNGRRARELDHPRPRRSRPDDHRNAAFPDRKGSGEIREVRPARRELCIHLPTLQRLYEPSLTS